LFNTMFVADMLDAVYSGAQNIPGQVHYFAASVSAGHFCLLGVINAAIDCSTSAPVAPYPQYYAYKLLGSSNYLNLSAGGRMAVSVSPLPSTTGLVVTGFWTSKGDAIVIVNPSGSDVTNVTVSARNTGTSNTSAARYLLNETNGSITPTAVTFATVSGGMQYTTTIPAYSVVAFLLTP